MQQDGKKGKRTQRKTKQPPQQKPLSQEQRSIEERFLTKSEAKAKGEDEPAVAFQKRLEALKRDSRAKLKVVSCLHVHCMHHLIYQLLAWCQCFKASYSCIDLKHEVMLGNGSRWGDNTEYWLLQCISTLLRKLSIARYMSWLVRA